MQRQLDPRALSDHLDRLYRAAWALCGSREDAEDLVQETYTRVLARPRLLRDEDDLGYLLTALRNTFLNRRRAEKRRPAAGPLPEALEPAEERTHSDPEATLEVREVYGAVASLPPDYRDVLAAVDVAGLSYEEASSSLGIPIGTVMSRLYRARRQVARSLEGMA